MVKKPMSVSVDRADGEVVVVKISGEIGLDSIVGLEGKFTGVAGDNALDAQLRSAVPAPVKTVVVDLTEATYLSSLGIGTLVRFRHRVAPNGGFRVVATGNLVTLFKFGRLDQLFQIHSTVEEALKEK